MATSNVESIDKNEKEIKIFESRRETTRKFDGDTERERENGKDGFSTNDRTTRRRNGKMEWKGKNNDISSQEEEMRGKQEFGPSLAADWAQVGSIRGLENQVRARSLSHPSSVPPRRQIKRARSAGSLAN